MESTTESKRKVSPKYVRSTNYNKSKINRQKENNQIVNQTNHDEFAKNTKECITTRQEFTDQQTSTACLWHQELMYTKKYMISVASRIIMK